MLFSYTRYFLLYLTDWWTEWNHPLFFPPEWAPITRLFCRLKMHFSIRNTWIADFLIRRIFRDKKNEKTQSDETSIHSSSDRTWSITLYKSRLPWSGASSLPICALWQHTSPWKRTSYSEHGYHSKACALSSLVCSNCLSSAWCRR